MNLPNRYRRPAFSLLEMLAVLAILGLVAAAASGVVAGSATAEMGGETAARRLALDLLQARRRAIATGDNHLVVPAYSGSEITGYAVHRRTGPSSTAAVDDSVSFDSDLTVTISPAAPEFTFEGAALASSTITIAGPRRTWTITVMPAAGSVQVSEL